MIYQNIIRPIVFRITDPEKIHHAVIKTLGFISEQKPVYNIIKNNFDVNNESLNVELGNLKLHNPVGLAAGFDKYIEAPLSYPMLGFGFAELGSITYNEQPGNPKPRLWRIPEDKGLIVYYGLSNSGVKKTIEPLSKLESHPIPYGISIAPTTGLKLEEMADDYIRSFLELNPYGDYITLNVSCPNVASCDMFSQVSFIVELLEKIGKIKKESKISKDIFIKIGPHHTDTDLDRIIESCINNGFTGIIATNLIKNRSTVNPTSDPKLLDHPGGISGKLTQKESERTIKYIYKKGEGKLKIIGVGGIFSAEDAYRKIKLGASAVQLITGFVYGGPAAIKNINKGLIELLKKDGYKNISEAIGKEA